MTTTPRPVGRPRKVIEPTGEYYTCSLCGHTKDTSEFVRNRARPRGFESRCYDCQRTLKRSSRVLRTQEEKNSQKAVSNNRKRQAILDAKDKPCADCGQKFPYFVMDLDHLPEFTKVFQLGKYMYHTMQEIEDELAKCEAVCANCHRYRTARRSGMI